MLNMDYEDVVVDGSKVECHVIFEVSWWFGGMDGLALRVLMRGSDSNNSFWWGCSDGRRKGSFGCGVSYCSCWCDCDDCKDGFGNEIRRIGVV